MKRKSTITNPAPEKNNFSTQVRRSIIGLILGSLVVASLTGCLLPGQRGGPPGLPGLPGLPRGEIRTSELVAPLAAAKPEDLSGTKYAQIGQDEASAHASGSEGQSYE